MADPADDANDTPAERRRFSLFRKPALRSPQEALHPDMPPEPPPPAPRKRRRRGGMLSVISGMLSLILVTAIGAAIAVSFAQQKVRSAGPLAEDKIVYIAPRTEMPDILAQLEREGVIDSPTLLNATLWVEGNRSNVKAGEYLFKREASLREVIDTLVSGKQVLHPITIPEGLTTDQIMQRLREADVLAGDLREQAREGVILPETYMVTRGMSRSELFRKMQNDQRRLVEQVWAKRDPQLPLRTPHELVTLASIVEKETGRADERPRVASVFVNRLNRRMRLQSDPTIVYGIVGGRGTLGRGITRAEITAPSPYNTYVIDGLPPGPIANPGRAALEAVANPAKTKDLYFVADGTGGHAFAETLDQHSRNVARWRQIEKERLGAAADVDRAPAVVPGDPGVPPLTPSNVAPPRGQRGALDLPGPGHALVDALPRMASFDVTAGFGPRGWSPAGQTPETILFAQTQEQRRFAAAQRRVTAMAHFDMGPGIDQFEIRGVTDRPELDGGEEMGQLPDETLYPVSPRRLADQQSRAARLGLDPGSSMLSEPDPPPMRALALQPTQQATAGIRRIFDASEGTALDPLKNKSWDLNSPQKIPSGVMR